MKKNSWMAGIICLFIFSSCVIYHHSKSCEPDAKKTKHYNNLQFQTAHVKSLKKKR
jgi:hypothetical protein